MTHNPFKFEETYLENPKLAQSLIQEIEDTLQDRTLSFMEVCGSHTMAIARYGIRSILPPTLKLLSGPGCPVCVTSHKDVDTLIALAQMENVILVTFGDMVRVPGSTKSLNDTKAEGHDVRVVYSPLDALEIAEKNPEKEVVFAAIGFETTTPLIAAALETADKTNLKNFSIVCMHKTMPQALEAIVNDEEVHVDGLILPGHVCTVTGLSPFEFLPQKYGVASVVVGFKPVEILQGILMLIEQIVNDKPSVENAYPRVVKQEGNVVAQDLIKTFFEPAHAEWRGLGVIPNSGLVLKEAYKHFDAIQKLEPNVEPTNIYPGCKCGDVLRGAITPNECKLFGSACTPESPLGPCMVSSEGSCAAYYRYHLHT